MRTVTPLFSKVFSVNELSLTDSEINKIIYIIENEEYSNTGNEEISKGSFISKNKYLLNKRNLLFLKKKIEKDFKQFMYNDLHYTNDFKMTTSWIAKIDPGGHSHWHNHNNCFFSGVFYLTTNHYVDDNDNSGGIVFSTFSNNRFELVPNKLDVLNSRNFCFYPKQKEILYFPAEVYHRIYKNNSQSIRYSIAFNFIPIGEIGSGDSQLNL